MKPKKAKKQRPNVHTEFHLSDEACSALSNAILFLINLKDFSFEESKISYDSADSAEEKLSCKITDLTRGEVRATTKAIDVTILRISDGISEYVYMEEDFPGLLSDLCNNLSILRELQPVFQNQVKKLNKMK